MRIEERVLQALRTQEKMGMELADELFISRRTAWDVLTKMHREGRIFRRFRHNVGKNCPDYLYSLVPFAKPAQAEGVKPASQLLSLLGDIDAIDFRRVMS